MKKILIVDGADKCSHCQFCYADQSWINTTFLAETKFCAAAKESRVLTEYGKEDSPDWCPLKELPEHKNTISLNNLEKEAEENHVKVNAQAGFNLGWNACIDAIEGSED